MYWEAVLFFKYEKDNKIFDLLCSVPLYFVYLLRKIIGISLLANLSAEKKKHLRAAAQLNQIKFMTLSYLANLWLWFAGSWLIQVCKLEINFA